VAGRDVLLVAGGFDKQFGGFAIRHHPADHVAADDVEDDVVRSRSTWRGPQFGDVPTPELMGAVASSSASDKGDA